MKANESSRNQRRLAPCYALVFLVMMAACAGGGPSYTGRAANPESIAPLLRGDVRELRWQTNDLIIAATYVLDGDQLDLAGKIDLQPRLINFPIVDYLRINVHAIDGSGVILASYPLWSAGAGNEPFFINWSFQRRYTVPDDTQALTFSYRGRMRDGGGRGRYRDREDGAATWDFWHTP